MLDLSRRFGAARAALAAAMVLFGFQSAYAIECIGKPNPVLLYKEGVVGAMMIWNDGSSGFYHLCNTSGEFGGISSEVCLSWYATLMRAKGQLDATTGQLKPLNVAIGFNTNVPCAQVPGNSDTPTVQYLGLY